MKTIQRKSAQILNWNHIILSLFSFALVNLVENAFLVGVEGALIGLARAFVDDPQLIAHQFDEAFVMRDYHNTTFA
jgi:hypothetical protein